MYACTFPLWIVLVYECIVEAIHVFVAQWLMCRTMNWKTVSLNPTSGKKDLLQLQPSHIIIHSSYVLLMYLGGFRFYISSCRGWKDNVLSACHSDTQAGDREMVLQSCHAVPLWKGFCNHTYTFMACIYILHCIAQHNKHPISGLV